MPLSGAANVVAIFLSTPSTRRATRLPGGLGRVPDISIHALREEGDKAGEPVTIPINDFYPRPPRGGRPIDDLLQVPEVQISIHALREEGDLRLDQILDLAAEFLSTPSARRATDAVEAKVKAQQISIHALREEGDAAVNDLLQRHNISIHALREEGD